MFSSLLSFNAILGYHKTSNGISYTSTLKEPIGLKSEFTPSTSANNDDVRDSVSKWEEKLMPLWTMCSLTADVELKIAGIKKSCNTRYKRFNLVLSMRAQNNLNLPRCTRKLQNHPDEEKCQFRNYFASEAEKAAQRILWRVCELQWVRNASFNNTIHNMPSIIL